MKKIIYSLTLIMILISCAAKKQMISSTTTTTDIITDSASEKKNITEDLQIEWFYDGEEASGITDTSGIPKWLKPVLPPSGKPPKKGKLKISISKHFSSSSNQTKVEKSAKIKKKEKAKTTEKTKGNVKSKNWKWLAILIIAIIIGFIVKYLLEHKNNIKKTWRKIKKSLSLHQP